MLGVFKAAVLMRIQGGQTIVNHFERQRCIVGLSIKASRALLTLPRALLKAAEDAIGNVKTSA